MKGQIVGKPATSLVSGGERRREGEEGGGTELMMIKNRE
jgi:hypothetical protein